MPKQSRITAAEAERLLLKAGFSMTCGKGSHRVYRKGRTKVVVPFHGNRTLHPGIAAQIFAAIREDVEADETGKT
ncbi:MAG: type II toxin-antitoxin system HicA family toxin [Candidatus Hydrogenedentes bacterium]|nr:type II toxin-antitoxin system HicA family toxin [Candidatus Hydrogenedentota bacterium]